MFESYDVSLRVFEEMTAKMEITKDDIPWIEQTILDARSWGHNKVADMLAEALQELLRNGE
jgi:hypothetical protein